MIRRLRRRMILVVLAGLLLLIALLASNFWLTLGILGIGYILTVPISGLVFLRVRARFETESVGEREASVSE
jgi:hypothetical protein